jgi:hypothetical protein
MKIICVLITRFEKKKKTQAIWTILSRIVHLVPTRPIVYSI